jgi:hypothetical protein
MPITNTEEESQVELVHNDELTLEAEATNAFLEAADFSAVFTHPAVKKHIRTATEETEDGSDVVEWVPGDIVLQVIDEDDLFEMFVEFVESMPEETLEDVATKSAVMDLLIEKPVKSKKTWGPNKKKSFKKEGKSAKPGGRGVQKRMIGAMLGKGIIKRTKKGKGYDGGDNVKGPGYKSQGTDAGKAAHAIAIKKGKNKKMAKKAALGQSDDHTDNMTETLNFDDAPHYGAGYSLDTDQGEVTLSIGVRDDATIEAGSVFESIRTRSATDLCTPIARGAGLAGSLSKLMG